jgi:threonine synthase
MKNSVPRYICPNCGQSYEVEVPLWRCPSCLKSHLNLNNGPGLSRDDVDGSQSSLWRYGKALRISAQNLISLGEGCTPIIERTWDGLKIYMKLDFLCPTGSFKDRGTAVMMTYLQSKGINNILEDSSGNAGASMAAYAASAGIHCCVFVPASAPSGKLLQMTAVGAQVVPVEGTRQDVSEKCFEAAETTFYASHNRQAFFLEGTKTVAYEIWEQLGFSSPDNIVVPVGGGSNVLGCYIGFSELLRNREVDRIPRIFGVQAANCAPLHAAFSAGADELVPTQNHPTIADGIALSSPVRVKEILTVFRETGGCPVVVSEDEIVMALRSLVRSGLFVEPTSAAAAAGLSKLIANREITKEQRTILILTGSGLKAAGTVGHLLGV